MKAIFVTYLGSMRNRKYLFYDVERKVFVKSEYNFKLYIVLWYMFCILAYSSEALVHFEIELEITHRIVIALSTIIIGFLCGKFSDLYNLTYNLSNEYPITKTELDSYLSSKIKRASTGKIFFVYFIIMFIVVNWLVIFAYYYDLMYPISVAWLFIFSYGGSSYFYSDISFRDTKDFIEKYRNGEIEIDEN